MSEDVLRALCQADPVWQERYQGFEVLGQGAAATVVRVHARAQGQDLAVKVFTHLQPEDLSRFQEEVRNAQRLTSPHVVRTFSPFVRGTLAWIEQELVDGPDLRREIERRQAPFPAEEATAIGLAIARALQDAHREGVAHRDVKPANVLLPRSGPAKLGDFGISRLAGAERITQTGLIAATPQFAAPEVVNGARGGPEADVYGLGLCLYLMLTGGRFPFDVDAGTSPARWLRLHADEPPRPLQEVAPRTPQALAALVDGLLVKDPLRRPAAADVVAALGPLAPEGPAPRQRVPGPAGGGVDRPSRRGRGAAIAGLLAAGVASWLLWPQAGPAAPPIAPSQAGGPASPIPAAPSVAPAASPPSPVVARSARLPSAAPPSRTPAAPALVQQPAASLSLEARWSGDLLVLANVGPEPLRALSLSAGRASATLPDGLAVGEALHLSLDAFAPPLSDWPATLEAAFTRPGGGEQRTRIVLPRR